MDNLHLFFEAIDNYNMWYDSNLIKYAVKVCMNEQAEKYYKKFCTLIADCDLYGMADLTDPIHNEYLSL